MAPLTQLMSGALAIALVGMANAAPTVLHADPNDFAITPNNTFKSTRPHTNEKLVAGNSPPSPLPLTFTNNFPGGGSINAYLTGTDGDGAAFFLQSDGTPFYPPNPAAGIPPTSITHDIAIPVGEQGQSKTVNLPNFVTSGRIYFAIGEMKFAVNNGASGPIVVGPSFTNAQDASADINYGFAEFTWDEDAGLYSNLSYVDFIGLVISQLVETNSNGNCEVLKDQAGKDGQPWDQSCQTDTSGNAIRVLSPLHLREVSPGALDGYYDDYVNQVWTKYSSEDLTITAPDIGKNFTGRVDQSGSMNFDEGGSFQKPTIDDILGCNSGPFSNPSGTDDEANARKVIVPRLCAAFVRSTLLLDGGNLQPDGITDTAQYYSVSPTDHYSRIVHEKEVDGKGYAFAYDDVHPSSLGDVSGLCNDPSPKAITFTVGGPPS